VRVVSEFFGGVFDASGDVGVPDAIVLLADDRLDVRVRLRSSSMKCCV